MASHKSANWVKAERSGVNNVEEFVAIGVSDEGRTQDTGLCG